MLLKGFHAARNEFIGKSCRGTFFLDIYQSINQSNYFIVRAKVDQRAGQLSLPHVGITKTEKIK